MEKNRFSENEVESFSYSTPSDSSPVLVVCPDCKSKAFIYPGKENEVRFTCPSCSRAKSRKSDEYAVLNGKCPGEGTELYFGLELWLQENVKGNLLWAYTYKHLDFIEAYVSSELRERSKSENGDWHNSHLASRLPKWLKSGKNRDSVVKAISRLRKKEQ